VNAELLAEWTRLISEEKPAELIQKESYFVFRLGQEWLALPGEHIKRVKDVQDIHTVPHKSDSVFLGIVNIDGDILPCFSLYGLLGVEETDVKTSDGNNIAVFQSMITIEKDDQIWVFQADEVFGIRYFQESDSRNVPATLSGMSPAAILKIFKWKEHQVGLLDSELVFRTLKEKIG